MEDTGESGQDLPSFEAAREPPLSVVARAVAHLRSTGRLQVGAWSDAYAQLRPLGHPLAHLDAPDAGFLAAAWGIGGAPLFGAAEILVTVSVPRALPTCSAVADGRVELRLPPGPEARGDGLAVALGLQREADKLRHALRGREGSPIEVAAHLMGASPEALAEAVEAPLAELAAGLEALTACEQRTLCTAPDGGAAVIDDVVLDLAAEGDSVYVFAGATERVHDLVSPYTRRLGARLGALVGGRGDDAAYDALGVLLAAEPATHDERLSAEAREGLTPCGRAVVVRFDAIDIKSTDPRARNACRALRGTHTTAVLCDRDPGTLAAVLRKLGARVRVLVLLAEGIAPEGVRPWPDVIIDPMSGHPLELDNALTTAEPDDDRVSTWISPPSLGFTPVELLEGSVGSAPLAYPLLYEAISARARGELSRRARVAMGTFMPGDGAAASEVALRCLERLAGRAATRRRHSS